jgi:hypothetical protein
MKTRVTRFIVFFAVGILFLMAQWWCLAHYEVRYVDNKDPKSKSMEGFRYSLPAPYLIVTNMKFSVLTGSHAAASAESSNPTDASKTKTPADSAKPKPKKQAGHGESNTPQNPTGSKPEEALQEVSATLLWLPDPDQTYAINVKGGTLGTFNGTLSLNDGWMVTGVNQSGDTKTVETLTALSGLIGGLLTPAAKVPKKVEGQQVTTTINIREPFLYIFKIDTKENKLIKVLSDDLKSLLLEIK